MVPAAQAVGIRLAIPAIPRKPPWADLDSVDRAVVPAVVVLAAGDVAARAAGAAAQAALGVADKDGLDVAGWAPMVRRQPRICGARSAFPAWRLAACASA